MAAQTIHGGADGGRVVGEVVIHRDGLGARAHSAAHFHAATHVFKRRQGLTGLRHGHAHMLRSDDGGQGIHLVVHPAQTPLHPPLHRALMQHLKVRRLTAYLPIGLACFTKTCHLAPLAQG